MSGKLTELEPASVAAKRKQGRPVTRWLGLEDVAELLGVEPDWLAKMLAKAPGCVPGGRWDGSELMVKEAELWKALGLTSALPQTCSVEEAAGYLGKSHKTVYAWLRRTGPRGEQLIRHWKHAGCVRLSVKDVLCVPAKLPTWARSDSGAVSSFFVKEDDANE